MRAEIRQFLHDEIAELLGLSGKKVIWANQGAPKQLIPLVTLRAYSEQGESMADVRGTDTAGKYDFRVPTAFVLEVQYYSSRGTFPVDIVEDLVRQFERYTVTDAFMAHGVAFVFADPVQDLTGLLGNEQEYEPRAAVDLHLRYTSQVFDEPGFIQDVSVHGETPMNMDFTVES